MNNLTDAERAARMRRAIEGGDRVPGGSVVDTSRSLARVNYDAGMKLLPELHQARWAERYGELMRERAKAKEAGDTGKVEELREAILDHHKTRWDTSGTRARIEADYLHEAPEEARRFFAKHRGHKR